MTIEIDRSEAADTERLDLPGAVPLKQRPLDRCQRFIRRRCGHGNLIEDLLMPAS
jgi:hypothetical protein